MIGVVCGTERKQRVEEEGPAEGRWREEEAKKTMAMPKVAQKGKGLFILRVRGRWTVRSLWAGHIQGRMQHGRVIEKRVM